MVNCCNWLSANSGQKEKEELHLFLVFILKGGGGIRSDIPRSADNGEPTEESDKACTGRAQCCPHQECYGHRYLNRMDYLCGCSPR